MKHNDDLRAERPGSQPGAPDNSLAAAGMDAPLSSDPNAGRTFKPVIDSSPAPKRGRGRPPKSDTTAPASTASRPASKTIVAGKPNEFHQDGIRSLLQTAATVEGFIAALLVKVDPAKAVEIWRYSPTELDMLTAPATRCANKWLPEWVLEYSDEIELVGMLAPMMIGRVFATMALRDPELAAKVLASFAGQIPPKPAGEVVPMRPPAPPPKTEPERPQPETNVLKSETIPAETETIPAEIPIPLTPIGAIVANFQAPGQMRVEAHV